MLQLEPRIFCTRLKLSSDGMNCNAGNPCYRNAKQLRSDGRVFCNPCAKTEKNAIFADKFTWAAMNAKTAAHKLSRWGKIAENWTEAEDK